MEKPLKICAAVLFSLILFFNSFTYGSDETYDVVIKSGTIVDGTGNPGFVADIGIGGDKITVIRRIPEALGKCVIDARGLIVAPGFIDVHTHTDRRIDSHSNAENYLFQGVTTVVGGNCGVYEGALVRERAILASGVVLTGSTPIFDAARGEIYRREGDKPLEVPAGAVVVPGARAIGVGPAKDWGLSVYAPIIIKYRDEKTEASVKLEEFLR